MSIPGCIGRYSPWKNLSFEMFQNEIKPSFQNVVKCIVRIVHIVQHLVIEDCFENETSIKLQIGAII
jgi:hypothetical protein